MIVQDKHNEFKNMLLLFYAKVKKAFLLLLFFGVPTGYQQKVGLVPPLFYLQLCSRTIGRSVFPVECVTIK